MAGSVLSRSWWSIRQQATGIQDAGHAAKKEVHAKSKEIMQACNNLPKINQFVDQGKRNEMKELVIQ